MARGGARLAVALLLLPLPLGAQSFELAVTVDDVPWTGGATPDSTVLAGTHRLLLALESRGVPATGRVVCDRIAAHPQATRRWIEGGHILGSHTAGHLDIDRAPASAWDDGVRRCDAALRALLGDAPRFFRFPFLHEGATPERRARGAALLAELGYRNAHVSVDNSEWIVAGAYASAAARGDRPRLASLGAVYVEHLRAAAARAREVARARFGREVRQVLLLHANLLNADHVGALLDSLRADGARFVSLEHALADPVYALPDGYVGPMGLSWLYRAAPARPDLARWDEEAEAQVRRMVTSGATP